MNSDKLFVGIDTSCYTTSVAVMNTDEIFQEKKMLEVKSGECGLRQSDALFQHVKNLPQLFDKLKTKIDFKNYKEICVTVSARPRTVEGSYMPVFLAGQSFARVVADVLGAKYHEVSHQDGHIMAAIYSCQKYDILEKSFLVYHLSGGTTELLLCNRIADGFNCKIVGGTKDLPAGQFIDRIGVLSGMSFPCGRYLDAAAVQYSGEKPSVKICVNDGYINFSGEETRYNRMLKDGADSGMVAYSVMKCIAESVRKSIEYAKERYTVENVLMVGGVSSSEFIRQSFSDLSGVYFADKEFSTDNGAGVCVLGKMICEEMD